MIVVRTPEHPLFNYSECKEMFDKYNDKIDVDDYDTVIRTTHFFSFIDWNKGELIGCIYFYQQDGRVYVTAFAGRKHHLTNLECFKKSLTWYNCDIYAECRQKTAILCLLKSGFKKLEKDIYVYRRKING